MNDKERTVILQQVEWSAPMGLKKWAYLFKVHPNTMSAWFKAQVIRNQQISARRWRVAVEELPAEITRSVLGA